MLALSALCGCSTSMSPIDTTEEVTSALSQEDRYALSLGQKILKIEEALKHPEKKESIDAVKDLGLMTRNYAMVRGWVLQHISMAESYRDVSNYNVSEEYKKKVEDRIKALKKMLRAIDLE
jgi:hypothetical protein